MTIPDPLTVLDCHLLQQLGERLRRRRKASGVSMVEMAGRAGISRMTLGAVEAGDPSATMGSYLRVMAVLGLSGEMARVASDVLSPAAAPPDGIRSRRVRPAVQVIISADETRHQIQDQQSLALHRQAVRAVKQDPALLDQAITALERWRAATPDSRSASLWHEWGQILKDRSWRKILSSNLEALLSKLNRYSNGEETQCAIIKVQQASSAYRQTMREILVVAVDDEKYYALQARPAGEMYPLDEESLTVPSTGIRNSSTTK